MTPTSAFYSPKTLDELLELAAAPDTTILAGGTDLMPRWTKNIHPTPKTVVDAKHIEQLKGVKCKDNIISVGACTPLDELAENPTIQRASPVLAEAAGKVACPQVRNRATIGGNLVNASPAADTAVPLILLDAAIVIAAQGPTGAVSREIPITAFFRGPGQTALKAGEILTTIRFHTSAGEGTWAWQKFGTRPSMEIAVASVGMILRIEDEIVAHTRIGYGSVAPVPMRGAATEAALLGQRLNEDVLTRCVEAAQDEITPISDIRASAAYRREVIGTMLRRMLIHAKGK